MKVARVNVDAVLALLCRRLMAIACVANLVAWVLVNMAVPQAARVTIGVVMAVGVVAWLWRVLQSVPAGMRLFAWGRLKDRPRLATMLVLGLVGCLVPAAVLISSTTSSAIPGSLCAYLVFVNVFVYSVGRSRKRNARRSDLSSGRS